MRFVKLQTEFRHSDIIKPGSDDRIVRFSRKRINSLWELRFYFALQIDIFIYSLQKDQY